jgi:hypothetical protein
MRFTNLTLKNFTCFRDASFDFVPGVNVLVGENGTGKTHVLKVLHHMQVEARRNRWKPEAPTRHDLLEAEFGADIERRDFITTPISTGQKSIAEVGAELEGKRYEWSVDIDDEGTVLHTALSRAPIADSVPIPRAVLIPATDMLAHTRRFMSTYDEFNIDFDRTERDIVGLLLSPEKRNVEELGIDIVKLTGGRVLDIQEEDERFYIVTSAGRINAKLASYGHQKLAAFVVLYRNGWIRPGSILLWDEPEANVGPGLTTGLIHSILDVARAGAQVIFATHSYFLLKELDLEARKDEVRFFGLKDNGEGVIVRSAGTYDEIEPNRIAEQFDSIYDRQLTRATGRSRKGANGR